MGGARGDLAGLGARVAAALLDGLVVGAVAVAVILAVRGENASVATDRAIIVAVALLGSLLYASTLMCRTGAHNGQTLGKQALSIRAVREDAAPITASTALVREFVGKGLLGLIPLFTIVDSLWAFGDARRQALHDKLAHTFVVRADAVPDHAPAADPFGGGQPERLTPPAGWAPPSAAAPSAPPPPPAPAAEAEPARQPPEPARAEDDPVRGPFGPGPSDPR